MNSSSELAKALAAARFSNIMTERSEHAHHDRTAELERRVEAMEQQRALRLLDEKRETER